MLRHLLANTNNHHHYRYNYRNHNHTRKESSSRSHKGKKRFITALAAVGLVTGIYFGKKKYREMKDEEMKLKVLKSLDKYLTVMDSRDYMVNKMKESEYDLVIIGGGVTGAGIALDATTRGLKVALVERNDFGAATSSRSTKLIHGGVRYLEKAFKNLDYGQYELVKEALQERRLLMKNTAHFSNSLPILLPVNTWWKVPYFWIGVKVYDWISGSQGLESSYYVSKEKALELFPVLRPGSCKSGAIVYFDGQTDDARLVLSLIQTAAEYGAKVANYVSAESFIKSDDGIIEGIIAKDVLSGETFTIKAKGVISAAGPFTDEIRKMDDENVNNLVVPSAGVHIVLPKYYCPNRMGLLDPATSDGRVIFFLPWYNSTITGTTDTPSDVQQDPVPLETDIHFLLNEISKYIDPSIKVRRADVLSAWSGIRPLVLDPEVINTENLSRTHIISTTDSKLLFISGGKLTTYRSMAEEAVDRAIELFNLSPASPKSLTQYIPLVGSRDYTTRMPIKLIHKYGLKETTASHLSTTYGTKAEKVMKLANSSGLTERIIPTLPIIEAEVIYSIDNEFTERAVDFIARRTRVAFVDANKALIMLPKVVKLMGDYLDWDDDRRELETNIAKEFLVTMGISTLSDDLISEFNEMELIQLRETFYQSDNDATGSIKREEVLEAFNRVGVKINFDWEELVKEKTVSFQTFLDIARVSKQSGNFQVANVPQVPHSLAQYRRKSEVDRSGGGF